MYKKKKVVLPYWDLMVKVRMPIAIIIITTTSDAFRIITTSDATMATAIMKPVIFTNVATTAATATTLLEIKSSIYIYIYIYIYISSDIAFLFRSNQV
jgi:hypothetical protein